MFSEKKSNQYSNFCCQSTRKEVTSSDQRNFIIRGTADWCSRDFGNIFKMNELHMGNVFE